MADAKFVVGSEVVRKRGSTVKGIVLSIRHEVASKGREKDETLIISVRWDSATTSFVSASALRFES